ncbi:hypothetical protein LGW84_09700, partial [Streptococcus mutans]|nr:hypothetical protein [Streptococcus mutans]
MTNKELEQYLLQSLNMGLGALMQGETSYTNSFDTKIMSDGFLFIPRLPAGYIIDEVLALSEGVNKTIKDSFFSLLSQIALLGRTTKVH